MDVISRSPSAAHSLPHQPTSVSLRFTVFVLAMVITTTATFAQEQAAGIQLAPKAFRTAAANATPLLVRLEVFGGNVAAGPTTGLILSSDGYILTSTYQLPDKSSAITCVTHDGKRRIAKLLGRDQARGIALLKIDATDLPTPKVALRKDLQVGQWAITLGLGLGTKQPALSVGILSALSRIEGRAVQTDAKISPTNYGGPLLDIEGRVIGVCTPLHPQSEKGASGVEWYDSGIGFAIGLDGLEPVIAEMKQGKDISPGYLGVALKVTTAGPIIAELQAGGPADKAKLQPGDQIVAIDKQTIESLIALKRAVAMRMAGDEVQLTIVRESQTLNIALTLGAADSGAHR